MTGPGDWPFPGESETTRARRVAMAYRTRLQAADAGSCAELDAVMVAWGQHWAVPRVQRHAPDDWVDANEAAEIASVHAETIRALRRRGRLVGCKAPHGTWRFQVRDIIALGQRRGRNRATAPKEETP